MSIRAEKFVRRCARFTVAAALAQAAGAWASVGGSISGIVKDPSGSVVVQAHVLLRETGTGQQYHLDTDNKGFYVFPTLPVGRYVLDIDATGFQGYERQGITLNTNAAPNVNWTSGPSFLQPVVIVPPRIARLGARLEW